MKCLKGSQGDSHVIKAMEHQGESEEEGEGAPERRRKKNGEMEQRG